MVENTSYQILLRQRGAEPNLAKKLFGRTQGSNWLNWEG